MVLAPIAGNDLALVRGKTQLRAPAILVSPTSTIAQLLG